MNKNEVIALLKNIRGAYPNFGKDSSDSDIVNVWSMALKDTDANKANARLIDYIKNNRFPPSPADIVSKSKASEDLMEHLFKVADACGFDIRNYTYWDGDKLLDHMIPRKSKETA